MRNVLPMLALSFLMVCCNKSEVYNKFDDDFSENRWQQDDAKTYEFTIDDATRLYNITFQFSHIYGYQFNTVPLHFTITDPKGEVVQKQIDLPIKDVSGKDFGDCSGDYCDLIYTLEERTALQKGSYKITVSHGFGTYLPNVLGVGMKVAAAGEVEVLGVKIK